jgi:hypothetical protein
MIIMTSDLSSAVGIRRWVVEHSEFKRLPERTGVSAWA